MNSMLAIVSLIRYLVFAAFVLAVFAAVGSWLLRTQRVSPFGPLGRGLRRFSDALIRPVEARMLSAGGNPVHAGWWLVVGVAVGGILLIGAVDWAIRAAMQVGWAARGGPRAVIGLMVGLAFKLVYIALFARVIGSWLGVGRYSRWLRPAYWLTDWLFEPLRRVIPPVGMFDVTPLAALFVLWVLEAIVRTVL